jgi:demethylmenaquinone methyltransferase/2-methoxy-6-polyprenyl-1,4-benzoquinol methylase
LNQREQLVQKIFDRIAPRYDLLNRIISFHLDTHWRKKLVEALDLKQRNSLVLDLGMGTGDLTFLAAKELGTRGVVVGLDFSAQMVSLAKQKGSALSYGSKAVYVLGSALDAPFRGESLNAIMTAFVLRNVANHKLFFREAYRILKPGGEIASLDMFPPPSGPFSLLYGLYFYRLVPWIGAALAGNHLAYQYLSNSVRSFDSPKAIGAAIEEAGFNRVGVKRFLRGAVCLHTAQKPSV